MLKLDIDGQTDRESAPSTDRHTGVASVTAAIIVTMFFVSLSLVCVRRPPIDSAFWPPAFYS
jgi:hypothetical protein